ncbi:hypothetical protein V8C37DRAFT_417534 [Trichoderma ceciliae]
MAEVYLSTLGAPVPIQTSGGTDYSTQEIIGTDWAVIAEQAPPEPVAQSSMVVWTVSHSTQVGVVAATPVSLMTLFDHVPELNPSFFVVDEAGRLTEAMSVVPWCKYPTVLAVFIGDTKQFGPMAIAEQDRQYNALFVA